MALHWDIQAKVQQELDRNVPPGVIPKPSDKYNLPFVEATLMEVHRYASIAPLGVDHCAREDTKIGTLDIPKGMVMVMDCEISKN